MEYPNSHLVDPASYDTTMDDLCANIPVRVHRNASLADRGALRAQKDWKQSFGSLPPGYAGTMGPEHNFVSICMPEILPDRLELMAYFIETAFIVDDIIDEAESPMAVAGPYMADILHAYKVVMAGGEMDSSSCMPVARIVIDLGRKMFAVDAERAQEAFRWLEKWTKLLLSSIGGDKEPRNIHEYLEYRCVSVSSQATFGLLIFALGLSIPENQQQMCLDLTKSFWISTSLTNDYHSWERERKASTGNSHDFVTNAIWVLMNKHSMTCDEAKAVCRERAQRCAAEYIRVVKNSKTRDDLCRDAKFFLDVLQFGISGNIVWGVRSPRYHPDRELSLKQREMAISVWADENIGSATNGTVHQDTAVVRGVPRLGPEALEAPSRYLDSLPGKSIRDKTIDALNIWFKVPPVEMSIIKSAINLLHGASLMIDDVQDSSQLRRGKPATHIVFGTVQTINTAGYRFLCALEEVRKLGSEPCMNIFCGEVRDLYTGQSHDLSWTYNLICPTEGQYLAMVDGKTAGLFRMLARMLDAKSDSPTKPDVTLLTRFMTLLGRLFQIRDDYMNLTSEDYTKQKGFCEDLDEGKYSLPLIYALGGCSHSEGSKTNVRDTTLLRNLLSQRHVAGRMSLDQKKLFLEQLKARGSFEYTRQALHELQTKLKSLAEQMGMLENESLRGLLEVLKV